LRSAGFVPRKNVAAAVCELAAAYREGRLVDRPDCHTVSWMQRHNLG